MNTGPLQVPQVDRDRAQSGRRHQGGEVPGQLRGDGPDQFELLGDESRQRPRRARIRHDRRGQGHHQPLQLGVGEKIDQVHLGELRQQHVYRDRPRDDHEQGARFDALQFDVFDLGVGADLDQLVTQVDQQLLVLAHRALGGGAQGHRLQHGERLSQGVGADHPPSRGDRPVGAHQQCLGAQEFGQVDAQCHVAGGDGPLPDGQDRDLVIGLQQQMVGREPAVRDPGGAQFGHAAPGVVQCVVADLLGHERIERLALGPRVGEQTGVRSDLACRQQRGRRRTGVLCRVRHQRALLQAAPHVEPAARRFAQPQRAPDRLGQARALQVTVQHVHLDGGAVRVRHPQVAAADVGDILGAQHADGYPGGSQSGPHLDPAGARRGGAERIAHGNADRPSRQDRQPDPGHSDATGDHRHHEQGHHDGAGEQVPRRPGHEAGDGDETDQPAQQRQERDVLRVHAARQGDLPACRAELLHHVGGHRKGRGGQEQA